MIVIEESLRVDESKVITTSSWSLLDSEIHESIEFAINSFTACQLVRLVEPTYMKADISNSGINTSLVIFLLFQFVIVTSGKFFRLLDRKYFYFDKFLIFWFSKNI